MYRPACNERRFWRRATINDLPTEGDEHDGGDPKRGFSRLAALELHLERHGIIGRLVKHAAEQCRHPLLLRFFCQAYRGQYIGEVADIRLKELLDRFWNQMLAAIAERMIRQGAKGLQDE